MITWTNNKRYYVRLLIRDDQEIRVLGYWLQSHKDFLIQENIKLTIVGFDNRKLQFNCKILQIDSTIGFIKSYFRKKK